MRPLPIASRWSRATVGLDSPVAHDGALTQARTIMVDINVSNFITVGLMAVLFTVVLKTGLSAAGIKPAWL